MRFERSGSELASNYKHTRTTCARLSCIQDVDALVNYLQYGLPQGDVNFVAEYIHQKGAYVNLSVPWVYFCSGISHFDPLSTRVSIADDELGSVWHLTAERPG